ncbi:FAD-binding oxidoreductase [Limibacillus sp. MBR-115]|jgi:D-amino-acid dehydrogenase|uniref:NAD(P)/FAD-dependent oxidoreductase n=1 Tax=Limibacillus sp. MBR-115 TaxID=3156465 RepID=UPI0033927BE5
MLGSGKGKKIVVVGAGIVGVSVARRLQEKGYQVTLIDRLSPGEACSHGNAGVISTSSCVPQILPGTWKQVPGLLLARDGPLAVDWRSLPTLLPWFATAQRAATPNRVMKVGQALHALHVKAVEDHLAQAEAANCKQLVQRCNYLHVYRRKEAYAKDGNVWKLRRELGMSIEELSAGELREAEPALAAGFTNGVLLSGHGRTLDPGGLVKALASDFEHRQGRILQREVRALSQNAERGVSIVTEEETINADTLVLAAGVWSAQLALGLGHAFPLVAERGYHIMYAEPGITLHNAIMFAEEKLAANSMAQGLRVAGTAEFTTNIDKAPNGRRIAMLERLATRYIPNLNRTRPRHWVGSRPTLPDTLPVIGRSQLNRDVIFAFGHGHTGLTASATTANIVSALVAGEEPPINIHPFRPERFATHGLIRGSKGDSVESHPGNLG